MSCKHHKSLDIESFVNLWNRRRPGVLHRISQDDLDELYNLLEQFHARSHAEDAALRDEYLRRRWVYQI